MATLGPVTDIHKFDEDGLASYLHDHGLSEFKNGVTVQQFQGGQSNPTYRLEAGGRRFVLRKKPPGELLPSAHAVDREYRVMKALADKRSSTSTERSSTVTLEPSPSIARAGISRAGIPPSAGQASSDCAPA